MGLFGKRAPARPRVLRAAGTRVDSSNRAMAQHLARNRDQWQGYAWGYRDAIGEVRIAVQFLSFAVSKVRFMAAELSPDSDDPVVIPGAKAKDLSIDARLARTAQEELARLPLDAGFDFWGMIAENFKIAGECWLHGFIDDTTKTERWRVRSVDEVIPQSSGEYLVRDHPGAAGRKVGKDEELIRLWVPHPRWHDLPDSPMRALLDSCEDLVLVGRELRAAARSRIAANGILKIPYGLSHRKNTTGDTSSTDTFIEELTEAITAPIGNEGDPGGVAPIFITGEKEDLEGLDHITLEREDSPSLLQKAEAALSRVVRGLDIPPEYVLGMADANHWTAWQIDATQYRQYIDPTVQLICDALTEGYLRPALIEHGFSPEQVAQVMVWRDAGRLTENPNRGTDAKDAWDRGAIGWPTLRDALGFGEDDAPTDDELRDMLAFKTGLDHVTAARILEVVTAQQPRVIQAPPAERQDDRDTVQVEPGEQQPATPDEATPEEPETRGDVVSSLIAALTDPTVGWTVDMQAAHDLADIDRELRVRILAATDAAMERALEKAGARVRSAAHNHKPSQQHFTTIKGLDPHLIPATLGRDTVAELGLRDSELIKGAFNTLLPKVAEWILDGALAAAGVLGKLLRYNDQQQRDLEARIQDTVQRHRDTALQAFEQRITDRLNDRLYRQDPQDADTQLGEISVTITPPGDAREVINTTVGGTTPSEGITGGVIHDTLSSHDGEQLGFQWRYGPTPPSRRFDPHYRLTGQRFTGWGDPGLATPPEHAWIGAAFRPGDHEGCLCDYVPVWAIPDTDAQLRERLGQESPAMRDSRLLAELDDAAGRTGTSAQLERDRRAAVLELQRRYIQEG